MLLHGDCLDRLKELPDKSIDSIVTDPPYGLSFMGKRWDYDVPSKEIWTECLRVLKPGGHLLSFGGTRTYHRLVVNIEDAGFEIRDQIQWIYGSGFPKSHDVSKAIDKQAGASRKIICENPETKGRKKITGKFGGTENNYSEETEPRVGFITAPSTDLAKQWQGWGTALKPANEPIVVARKPLEKGLTIAENVVKHGTGAINIDASRIASDEKLARPFNEANNDILGKYNRFGNPVEPSGRWPANLILDEAAAKMLDEQSGPCKTGNIKAGTLQGFGKGANTYGEGVIEREFKTDAATGASRFFYVAKASKSERNAGLEGMPKQIGSTYDGNVDHEHGNRKLGAHPDRPTELQQNHHPTVKPIKLMSYLIKLVTPPNGTVLDPFMGSGSTGVAAKELGFKFVGCELSEEYFEIAKKRMEAAV